MPNIVYTNDDAKSWDYQWNLEFCDYRANLEVGCPLSDSASLLAWARQLDDCCKTQLPVIASKFPGRQSRGRKAQSRQLRQHNQERQQRHWLPFELLRIVATYCLPSAPVWSRAFYQDGGMRVVVPEALPLVAPEALQVVGSQTLLVRTDTIPIGWTLEIWTPPRSCTFELETVETLRWSSFLCRRARLFRSNSSLMIAATVKRRLVTDDGQPPLKTEYHHFTSVGFKFHLTSFASMALRCDE